MRANKINSPLINDYDVLENSLKLDLKSDDLNLKTDFIVYLRPTTPFRKKKLIDKCIKKAFLKNTTSVRSVRHVGHWHPYWMLKINDKGYTQEFLPGKNIDKYYQSQLLPDLFKHDGYCDVIASNNIPLDCPDNSSLKEMYGDNMRIVINDDNFFVNIESILRGAFLG